MRFSAYVVSLAGLAYTSRALSPTDLGYWDVNITSIRSASGFESQLTWAVFSGNPNKTIYDEWTWDPMSGNTTAHHNDRSFRVSVNGICGIGPSVVSVKQTVDDGRREYWVAGVANVSFKVNTVTGRGGSASFRVNATLDDAAKDVCGRPLNHEPS